MQGSWLAPCDIAKNGAKTCYTSAGKHAEACTADKFARTLTAILKHCGINSERTAVAVAFSQIFSLEPQYDVPIMAGGASADDGDSERLFS